MHENAPFSIQKSGNFAGREHSPLSTDSSPVGRGKPIPFPSILVPSELDRPQIRHWQPGRSTH